MRNIVIVAATKSTQAAFWSSTPLGLSLARIGLSPALRCIVAAENNRGLPEIYNRALSEGHRGSTLVFVHDDVFIDDYWLVARLEDAFQQFDLVGLAGNRTVPPKHVGWAFAELEANGRPVWDHPANLSGKVCHRVDGTDVLSVYGEAPQACQLLDGLFLACRAEALLDRELRFDPQFSFHFYDLDFCRTCVKAGLRAGTWPVAATHYSGGAFGSPLWLRELKLYQEKWSEKFSETSLPPLRVIH